MGSIPSTPPTKDEDTLGDGYDQGLFVSPHPRERDHIYNRSQGPAPEEHIRKTIEGRNSADDPTTANQGVGLNEAAREDSPDFEITGERSVLETIKEQFHKAAENVANNATEGSSLRTHLHGMAALAKSGDKNTFVTNGAVWKQDLNRALTESEKRFGLVSKHERTYKKVGHKKLKKDFDATVKSATKLLNTDKTNVARCEKLINKVLGV